MTKRQKPVIFSGTSRFAAAYFAGLAVGVTFPFEVVLFVVISSFCCPTSLGHTPGSKRPNTLILLLCCAFSVVCKKIARQLSIIDCELPQWVSPVFHFMFLPQHVNCVSPRQAGRWSIFERSWSSACSTFICCGSRTSWRSDNPGHESNVSA